MIHTLWKQVRCTFVPFFWLHEDYERPGEYATPERSCRRWSHKEKDCKDDQKMWSWITLQGRNTDVYLLNVCCFSKKVCFIHTKLHHGRFRETFLLIWDRPLQIPWQVNKQTRTQTPSFLRRIWKKKPDITNAERQIKKNKNGDINTSNHVQGSTEIIMCTVPKKQKKQI